MTTTTLVVPSRTTWLTRAADFVELTKPRIALLVLVATAVSYFLARWGQADLRVMLRLLVGTSLVAASASALNQWLERFRDSRMDRTRSRPLPAGRLRAVEALTFAYVSIVIGVLWLGLLVNWMTAFWGLLTWFLYVWIYTPLKVRSWLNTAVGAVAGALPLLMGWAAAETPFDLRIGGLFTLLFLWQFPHFMAIAWLYREQYGRAGFQMLTVVDPSGRRASVQAVLAAVSLIPVSLLPALHAPGVGGAIYGAFALLLGVAQLAAAITFGMTRSEDAARQLLRASLVYLPTLLFLLAFVPLI